MLLQHRNTAIVQLKVLLQRLEMLPLLPLKLCYVVLYASHQALHMHKYVPQ
jgi:hypothetical protein